MVCSHSYAGFPQPQVALSPSARGLVPFIAGSGEGSEKCVKMVTAPLIVPPGLKASLERLQLEYVDVVFANRPDPNTPMEGRFSTSWPGLALFPEDSEPEALMAASTGPQAGHPGQVGGKARPSWWRAGVSR